MKTLTDRMTIPAAVLIATLLTCIAGIVLLFMQIKDTGTIDLQTPVIDGTVKSGFVGISLIFLSTILMIFSLAMVAKRDIEIRSGDVSVRLRGSFSRKAISEVIKTVQSSLPYNSDDILQQRPEGDTEDRVP